MVTSSDDPLYIVPAVVPDDEPATPARTRSATTQVTPVSGTDTSTAPTSKVTPPAPQSPAPKTSAPSTVPVSTEDDKSIARSIRFERPAVRRTTRTVRYIDPWSVFRVALVAHMVLYVVFLLAGVLLWNVANATGTVDNVERFMESFGWESFEFKGGELFHQAWVLGLFAVVGFTGLAVLAVTTFNLITDLVGGIRLTVLESRPPQRPRDRTSTGPSVRRPGESASAEPAVESDRPHR